jgi:hypothetical protein
MAGYMKRPSNNFKPITQDSGLIVASVGGAALIALTVNCWLVQKKEQSSAGKGMIDAILLYNIAALAILAYTAISRGL